MNTFRYILRYLIDPHFHASSRVREVVDFCKASRIGEVMMFVTAEELSAGHPTEAELEAYIALGRELNEALSEEGIALSLNPWSTTHHNARGRRLRAGQSFRLMVGETGVESPITACPLCTTWQEYLCDSFGRMAAGIRPTVIWIEDDWRLRNHDRSLGWGGCFCPHHLERFSAMVGQRVSREQLFEAILQPGRPHPWRDLWLDLSRETMLEPLRKLRATVRECAPEVRLALMSSNPDAHAAEGRDWHRFEEVLGEPFLSRPNMGPYTQYHALNIPPSVTRMTIANLRGPVEIYPELENSPRCGPYSKSRSYSIWQIQHCLMLGAKGVTINHYDMLGNGISLDPEYGSALCEAKPLLDALHALEIDDRQAGGVQVLFSPKISRAIETNPEGKGMGQLSQDSLVWSHIAFILGVSHRFTQEPSGRGTPLLVNGETLRTFDDAGLERLLAGDLVLDALAVSVLLERGYGGAIGVRSAERRRLAETAYSYEEIAPERWGGGIPARMTAQRISSWLLEMEAETGAEELSTIHHPEGQRLWSGALLYRNDRGGRIISLTYPMPGDAQLFMAFFNIYRKRFFEHLFFDILKARQLAVVKNPALHAYQTPVPGGLLLGVLNPTDDRVEEVIWQFSPEGAPEGGAWSSLNERGEWLEVEPHRSMAGSRQEYRFRLPVQPLRGLFLRWRGAETAQKNG